jgi:hypothetical protein
MDREDSLNNLGKSFPESDFILDAIWMPFSRKIFTEIPMAQLKYYVVPSGVLETCEVFNDVCIRNVFVLGCVPGVPGTADLAECMYFPFIVKPGVLAVKLF